MPRPGIAVDLISELPESVLVYILSFLPIKDAIKTEVLSKRWQFIWTYLPSLLFRFRDEENYVSSRKKRFVAFVERTLLLCNCSKIKKFGADFGYKPLFGSNINSWTRFAAEKGVEELYLEFHSPAYDLCKDELYRLPQLLYTNSSFKKLRFSSCKVIPKGVVAWNSLKKLSIGYAKLSNDVIQKILVGSPVLEVLELYHYKGFSRLHLGNTSVEKLILREFCGPWDEKYETDSEYDDSEEDDITDVEYDDSEEDGTGSELEISAPYLQSLEISGRLPRECELRNVSSLGDATLDCKLTSFENCSGDDFVRIQNTLRGLIQSLVHVKRLTLGAWALKVLSIMEEKRLCAPLKCECLTLCTVPWKLVLPGVAHMLESSPNLKTLVITGSSSSYHEDQYLNSLNKMCRFDETCYWTEKEKPFKCLMSRLREVKFVCLNWYEFQFYLPFVQFLLKNAMVLQKMVVSGCCTDSQKEFVQAGQKLLSFPRSSPDAVVLFYE